MLYKCIRKQQNLTPICLENIMDMKHMVTFQIKKEGRQTLFFINKNTQ